MRIDFASLRGWPGTFIGPEGCYEEGAVEKRVGIFIGPEFGTVRRSDLVEAAREAGDANFDVVIAYSDTSRPFPAPSTGRVAVKVINHLGDEVMKVFQV